MDNQLAIFVFVLLYSVSPSTVCIQCTSFMCTLRLFFSVFGEFEAPPIGLQYELQLVELLKMDQFRCRYSRNNAKEYGGEKDRFVCYVWKWPQRDLNAKIKEANDS